MHLFIPRIETAIRMGASLLFQRNQTVACTRTSSFAKSESSLACVYLFISEKESRLPFACVHLFIFKIGIAACGCAPLHLQNHNCHLRVCISSFQRPSESSIACMRLFISMRPEFSLACAHLFISKTVVVTCLCAPLHFQNRECHVHICTSSFPRGIEVVTHTCADFHIQSPTCRLHVCTSSLSDD